MKIATLGLWHQGVVGAACLVEMGHEVVGADSDLDRIARLRLGKAPLFEPGLDDLLAKGLSSGRLSFTADFIEAVRDASFVFIMFDTPVNDNDESDLTEIFRTVETIAPHLPADCVILVTAQVPVGTCDAILIELRAANPTCTATIAYMPENLRLGQAIARFMAPPLPVVGCDNRETFERLMHLLKPLAVEWHRSSLRTAEMLKHALNSYLALTICFANELGNLCDALGANGKDIAQLLRLDPRIGKSAMLQPGLGFSGGTLARDMQSLRRFGAELNIPTPLLDGAWAANTAQNQQVMRKLAHALPQLRGARVAVLGLTYKADTSTLRRSAAIEVISDLVKAGAVVSAHDPRADRAELEAHSGFKFCENSLTAVEGADALVLMTPWAEYRDIDFHEVKRRMAKPYLLDTAGLWNATLLTELGFAYDDIGSGRKAVAQNDGVS